MFDTYFTNKSHTWELCLGNCIEIMSQIASENRLFDMVFADPPYFLSNGGISVQNGKQVCVNKGDWDKSNGIDNDLSFTLKWLSTVRNILKPSGTIWISGTYHNIFQVAQCLNELKYKILNVITWQKTNPPPNLSCRYFTFSTEFIIWARKEKKTSHYFNYSLMKALNRGQQMRDVWTMPAIARWEKSFGKHPTQKPLPLLCRIILASTKGNECVLDPFTGSSTTGIACSLLQRNFLGIDTEKKFLDLSINRFVESQKTECATDMRKHLPDLKYLDSLSFKDFGINSFTSSNL